MRNWRSKKSKLLPQRSHPERAGCQAVLHGLTWGWRSCSNPVLGMDVSSSTTLSLCLPFISSVTAFSVLLSMVTFLYMQLCMCTDAHIQTCTHITYLFLCLPSCIQSSTWEAESCPHKDDHFPMPRTCEYVMLHGKGWSKVTDGINVAYQLTLGWGDDPILSWKGQCNLKDPWNGKGIDRRVSVRVMQREKDSPCHRWLEDRVSLSKLEK